MGTANPMVQRPLGTNVHWGQVQRGQGTSRNLTGEFAVSPIVFLQNNHKRMRYDAYRCAGLPTTSVWIKSAVKEMNFRIKGTEMFWNNPAGAEAILQIPAAPLTPQELDSS